MNDQCHEKCKDGNHPFMKVYSVGTHIECNVVRWCPECGAIVIDVDRHENISRGEIMKMRIPTISKTKD